MIINLTDEEVKGLKDYLIVKLIEHGTNVVEIEKGHWKIEDKKIDIYKDSKLFEYLGTEWRNTSIKPLFSIVDDERKEITVIHSRTQGMDGSVDQKLPYGSFIVKDYLSAYKEIEQKGYDFRVAFVLNSHFEEKRYIPLLDYLKSNSIYTWINFIKI